MKTERTESFIKPLFVPLIQSADKIEDKNEAMNNSEIGKPLETEESKDILADKNISTSESENVVQQLINILPSESNDEFKTCESSDKTLSEMPDQIIISGEITDRLEAATGQLTCGDIANGEDLVSSCSQSISQTVNVVVPSSGEPLNLVTPCSQSLNLVPCGEGINNVVPEYKSTDVVADDDDGKDNVSSPSPVAQEILSRSPKEQFSQISNGSPSAQSPAAKLMEDIRSGSGRKSLRKCKTRSPATTQEELSASVERRSPAAQKLFAEVSPPSLVAQQQELSTSFEHDPTFSSDSSGQLDTSGGSADALSLKLNNSDLQLKPPSNINSQSKTSPISPSRTTSPLSPSRTTSPLSPSRTTSPLSPSVLTRSTIPVSLTMPDLSSTSDRLVPLTTSAQKTAQLKKQFLLSPPPKPLMTPTISMPFALSPRSSTAVAPSANPSTTSSLLTSTPLATTKHSSLIPLSSNDADSSFLSLPPDSPCSLPVSSTTLLPSFDSTPEQLDSSEHLLDNSPLKEEDHPGVGAFPEINVDTPLSHLGPFNREGASAEDPMMNQIMSGSKSYDYLLKVLLVGDSDVGKQEILSGLEDGSIDSPYCSSSGAAYKTTIILIDGKRVKLQLWDTSGQGRFCTIIRSYSRGAQGILLVYDITNKWSFEGINRWVKEVEEHAPGIPKVLVGNRLHLAFKRQVDTLEAETYAEKNNMGFYEISPLVNFNITESFQELSRMALKRNGMERLWRSNKVLTLNELCCHSIVARTNVYGIEKLPLPDSVKANLKSYALTTLPSQRQGQNYKTLKERRKKARPPDAQNTKCVNVSRKSCVIA